MSNLLKVIVLGFYFLLPLEASSAPLPDKDYILPVAANELKIVSYNVENLFDAFHDEDKTDYEYLPIDHSQKANCPKTGRYARACRETDWTSEKVKLKYGQIQRALEAQGPLPDILVLTETENERVVSGLTKHLGYDDYVMTTSPDERGIDCAILFMKDKLRPLQFIEREVKEAMFPTRNLSVMLFEIDASLGGGVLAVFPNHWPSQGNPAKARVIVAKALRELVDEIRAKHKKETLHYIITGDFNTIDADKPHPIDTVLLDPRWKETLLDLRTLAKSKKHPHLSKMPPGTYYYGVDETWNELDKFFVSPELQDGEGLEVDPLSYRIHAPKFLTKTNSEDERIPFRYNHSSSALGSLGYSDHFAVVVKLKFEK
jgi:hypothetical protein